MFNMEKFLEIALPPADSGSSWYNNAVTGVNYIVENSRSDEIILYTDAGQSFIHAVLAPVNKLTSPDWQALQNSNISPYNQWRLEIASGGGEAERIYLASPVDNLGYKGLEGGQQLVFRRSFTDVDKGSKRTEISQPLVQALDLYWLDEESAYCRINEDGDIEPVIRQRDLSKYTGQNGDILVTIKSNQLHRYMAATNNCLVTKFDFTRFVSRNFIGWKNSDNCNFEEKDISYHMSKQPGASFANGTLIVRPFLTPEIVIEEIKNSFNKDGNNYAVFKAYDWKNNRMIETSCAPSALASYFENNSPLPFQITPAFFKPDVLLKYKSDPEKYTLDHRSIYARGIWNLKSYDVNEAGQVHTYLYCLSQLPYREQLYWQSFNEWPKAGISARAIKTDFEGSFDIIPDPLADLKHDVAKLDKTRPSWWSPRGEAAGAVLHYPLTASPEEWASALLALDQLVVEGFVSKSLRSRLESAQRPVDKQWGSLYLLQECLILKGLKESEATALLEPLKQAHTLRNKVKGHLAESDKQSTIKRIRTEYGSLSSHFRKLIENIQTSFNKIIGII